MHKQQNRMFNYFCIKSILSLIIIQCLSVPLLVHANTLTAEQTQFITTLSPAIHKANQHILADRTRLIILHKQFEKQPRLSNRDQQWLNKLATQYKINPDFSKKQTWQSLLTRVDIVPTALVLAQAINESGWGRSRFAKIGNNYFGQWCYVKGCGIVPAKRPPGKTYEVKRFSSVDSAITHYLQNLNTNPSYKALRELRQQLRDKNKPLNPLELSHGLSRYSQRRATYVKSIQVIIADYQLQRYDLLGSEQ